MTEIFKPELPGNSETTTVDIDNFQTVPQGDIQCELSELIRSLSDLFYNYSDHIPDSIVSGPMAYKVQNNWFQAVFLTVEFGISNGWIKNPKIRILMNIITEIKRTRMILSQSFPKLRENRTTQKEIAMANKIILLAMEDLMSQKTEP